MDAQAQPPTRQAMLASRRGIIVYIEYQIVCPFVGIGSPTPSPASQCVSPLGPKGGSNTRLRMRGPNSGKQTESLAFFIFCEASYINIHTCTHREETYSTNREFGIWIIQLPGEFRMQIHTEFRVFFKKFRIPPEVKKALQHCFICRPSDSTSVQGCWDRTQDCCNFGIGRQMLLPLVYRSQPQTRLDLIQNVIGQILRHFC